MNIKTKELMNLSKQKQSNILLGLFLADIKNENLLNEALYSVSQQELPVDLLIIHPGLSKEDLEKLQAIVNKPTVFIKEQKQNAKTNEVEVVENKIEATKPINFHIEELQINNFSKVFNTVFRVASENEYPAFSLFEKEDIIGPKWFSTAHQYMEENPDMHIFTPLIRNNVNGSFINYMNESAWAEGFAEEAGKFDMQLLNRFNCINPLGAVYKTEAIKEYSEEKDDGLFYPMKESIKISHFYEFFIRMAYNDVKIMSIPRVGYEMRIFNQPEFKETSSKIPQNIVQIPLEKGGITPEEGSFWMELAKKEYFFEDDRNKVYEEPKQQTA